MFFVKLENPLRFNGDVVRFSMDDPAHRILNTKDPVEWNRRRGRPNSSWLAQLGDHMKEWSMGRRRPGRSPGIGRGS